MLPNPTPDEAEREAIAFVVKLLRENPSKWGAPNFLGTEMKKNPEWAKKITEWGGLRRLVLRNPRDVRWVEDPRGGTHMGTVVLVAAQSAVCACCLPCTECRY